MKMPIFEMERMQSLWEHVVEIDLSESGVEPVTLRDLYALGLDRDRFETTRLCYSQTNGTPLLREALCEHYPGATTDHIQVTNGTSEANYLSCLLLLRENDELLFQSPNYMQMFGIPEGMAATVRPFSLCAKRNWEPDWEQFDRLLSSKTRIIYVSNPNNPTGSILSVDAMQRLVQAAQSVDAYLVADEVYQGAELDGHITRTFWGMSDRVIVTSGLSKAFGIPGLRIGWIVGPTEFVADCWAQHDYLTIGPGTLSDMAAQVAVRTDNRQTLFERTAKKLGANLRYFSQWAASLDGFLDYVEPRAGAFVFAHYNHEIPSVELVERLRVHQDVLVVPGAYLGMENYLRISTGVPLDKLEAGLARMATEFKAVRSGG